MHQDQNCNGDDILLKMTIDLGAIQDTILIKYKDKAQDLAEQFVQKHQLNNKVIAILVQNIQENIDQTIQENQEEEEEEEQDEEEEEEQLSANQSYEHQQQQHQVNQQDQLKQTNQQSQYQQFLQNQFQLYQRQQQSQQSKQDLFDNSQTINSKSKSQNKEIQKNHDELSTEKRERQYEQKQLEDNYITNNIYDTDGSKSDRINQQSSNKQLEMEDQIQKYFSNYENQFNQEYLQFNKEFHQKLPEMDDNSANQSEEETIDENKISAIVSNLKDPHQQYKIDNNNKITKEMNVQLMKNRQQQEFNSFMKQGKESVVEGQETQQYNFQPMINPRSEDLFRKNAQGEGNVYDRLFINSFIKDQKLQAKQQEHEQKRQSEFIGKPVLYSNQQYKDVGSRLYDKGNRMKQNTQRFNNKQQQEKEQEEQELYRFTPQINSISKLIVQNNHQNEKTPVEDRLYNQSVGQKQKHQKIQQINKQQQIINEIQQCTFKPQINEISSAIDQFSKQVKNNVQPKKRFEMLNGLAYQQEKKKRMKQNKQLNKTCSFAPQINDISRKLMEESKFYERLDQNENKKELKNKRQQLIIDDQIDGNTGEKMFRPQIGRQSGEWKKREPAGQVGDYLYEEGNRMLEKKQHMKQQQDKNIMDQQIVKSNRKSDLLVENKKQQQLQEIFILLDNDMDGQISALLIDISNLDTNLLELITPLLIEMEHQRLTLTQSEFVQAGLQLFQQLTPHQKHIFLSTTTNSIKQPPPILTPYNKSNTQIKSPTKQTPKSPLQVRSPIKSPTKSPVKCTFKPQLNQKSLQMEKQNRSKLRNQGVEHFQILYDHQKVWDNKKRIKQLNKFNQELDDCTFQPLNLQAKNRNNRLLKEN